MTPELSVQIMEHARAHGQVTVKEMTLIEEEAVALLDALKIRSLYLHDEALISLFCGLRAGEIYTLTWGGIDFANGVIHIKDTRGCRQ